MCTRTSQCACTVVALRKLGLRFKDESPLAGMAILQPRVSSCSVTNRLWLTQMPQHWSSVGYRLELGVCDTAKGFILLDSSLACWDRAVDLMSSAPSRM